MPAIHCHRAWQRLKERQQKGAFIVLTAFLLPLLIALSGTVIDFGNLYIHKARLQNATDAAAIAGAYAYLDYGDKAAGDTAKSYIMGDSGNLPKDTILTYEKYSAITEDGNTLYCVQLKESVPLYFLKYFLGPSQEIKAVSAASITHNDEPDTPPSEPDQPNKNNPFKNLFTFVDYLDLKNCVHQEAQNKNMQIFTSFDGTIAYTQNTSKIYSYGGSDDQKFYPSDTLGRHQGKDYDAVLKKGVGSEAQLSLDVYSYAKKIEEANKKRKDNDNDKAKNGDQYHIKLNSDQINQDSYYFTGTQGGTLQETILQMNKNSTYTSKGMVHINLSDTAGNPRIYLNNGSSNEKTPIFLTYLGQGQINFEGSGGKFFGIIYAPYATVYMNDNNFDFNGSIVAKSIRQEANGARFHYKDFSNLLPDFISSGDHGSSGQGGSGKQGHGGSGGKSGHSQPLIGLTTPPQNLSW